MTTNADANNLKEQLKKVNSELVPVEKNLIDIAWGNERPLQPHDKVFIHPVEFAGKKSTDETYVKVIKHLYRCGI